MYDGHERRSAVPRSAKLWVNEGSFKDFHGELGSSTPCILQLTSPYPCLVSTVYDSVNS